MFNERLNTNPSYQDVTRIGKKTPRPRFSLDSILSAICPFPPKLYFYFVIFYNYTFSTVFSNSCRFVPKSSNIIFQALLFILKHVYEPYFDKKVEAFILKYEMDFNHKTSYEDARRWVSGIFYLTEFKKNDNPYCPCCGHKINLTIDNVCLVPEERAAEKLASERVSYKCSNCEFMIQVLNSEDFDGEAWINDEQVINFECSKEFSLFLQLHCYLSEKIGEEQSIQLLKSLNILGSINSFDLDKRKYFDID